MGIVQRLAGSLITRLLLSGFPREWADPARLADWEAGHGDPNGDVWCVSPAYGHAWRLWPPGTQRDENGRINDDAAAEWPVDPVEDSEPTWLADVESWMRSWIEDVSGGRVVEMVEGLTWSEYVIYARVVTPS
jgi:hypothetical protein